MFDFSDIRAASKTEQVRAWSVDQAIDSFRIGDLPPTDEGIVRRAAKIEGYILNGKETG